MREERAKDAVDSGGKALCVGGVEAEGVVEVEGFIVVRREMTRTGQRHANLHNVIDHHHHPNSPLISSHSHRSLSSSTCCPFRNTNPMSSSTFRQIASAENVCVYTSAQSSPCTNANRNPSPSAPFTNGGGHRKRGAGLGALSTN